VKKALFLDRDGVINIDHGYVYKRKDFEFMPDIFNLIKLFVNKGYLVFIVTNQSGIGRGYYTLEDFLNLTEFMLAEFAKVGINIERVEYCPHSPESNCNCRKPKTGMIDSILKDYSINLDASWLIGDKQSDIDLAKNSKIKKKVAIGNREINGFDYKFSTISSAYEYLKGLDEL
jgi:D-glycero-D-manno-heptose 1,7-bisphosphate phosphatase